jgi:protein SCO1/2
MNQLLRVVTVSIVFSLASLAHGEVSMRTLSQEVGLDQHLNEQLPLDLEFTDEHGKRVKLGQYFNNNKPVIINCVYFRCPMLCTQVMNGLLKSAQGMSLRIGEDYDIISVSIDPRETPEMAAAKKETYVRNYRRVGSEDGWHFLTGDEASIAALTKAVGFRYRYDPESDQYAHASGIAIATPDGRLARYYYGIDYHPRDVRLGLVESAQHRIGNPVDQVLLMCFHYDPKTGRYGLMIDNVIRLAGVGFVVLLATYLVRMYFLERRRSAEVAARVAAKVI